MRTNALVYNQGTWSTNANNVMQYPEIWFSIEFHLNYMEIHSILNSFKEENQNGFPVQGTNTYTLRFKQYK